MPGESRHEPARVHRRGNRSSAVDTPRDALLTVAFSSHRIETLSAADELMRRHQAVVLEEPRTEGFAGMLTGAMTLEAYLAATDFEFPEFTRAACPRLRALHEAGIALYQLDPFMDELLAIHERFAAGGRPADIAPGTPGGRVFAVEKAWTRALLDYYERALTEPFDAVVAAVQAFARADAERGRLRDAMRARAVAPLLERHDRVYVEAGSLHLHLLNALRPRLRPGTRLRPVHLMEPVVRRLGGRREAWGPGDLLTLRYTYRPGFGGPLADLLAARSLVFVKILAKEELPAAADEWPHLRDELACIALVSDLDYGECARLYGHIKGLSTAAARRLVEARRRARR